MSRARTALVTVAGPARQLGRPAVVRVARTLLRPLLFLAGLRLGSALVGQWLTAAVAGPLVLGWVLARWAAVERRLDAHTRPTPTPVVVGPRGPGQDGAGEHVAFARALVAVSARYLAHCQHQADAQATSREGWR
jgi:hypothetical protein